MQLFSISFSASFSVGNPDIICRIQTLNYQILPGRKSAIFISKIRSHYYSSLVSRYHLSIQKIQTSKELHNHINKFCFLELLLSYLLSWLWNILCEIVYNYRYKYSTTGCYTSLPTYFYSQFQAWSAVSAVFSLLLCLFQS